jgi:xanthine dehydrogenase accessory factor
MPHAAFAAAAAAVHAGQPSAWVSVIATSGSTPRGAGAHLWVSETGETVGTIGGGALEHTAIAAALDAIRLRQVLRKRVDLAHDLGMCCGGQVELYIEPLDHREAMILYGAGHVAHAVAPLACALDFRVTVVDAREEWATTDRFPGCTVHAVDPLAFVATEPDGPRVWRLIVTHDHALDQELGERLLPRPCAWLGMIGSRAKIARFFQRWQAAGVDPTLFDRLSAPVGLDLGAETPAEIAVAIAAEWVRIRRDTRRPPEPLSGAPLGLRRAGATPPRWSG